MLQTSLLRQSVCVYVCFIKYEICLTIDQSARSSETPEIKQRFTTCVRGKNETNATRTRRVKEQNQPSGLRTLIKKKKRKHEHENLSARYNRKEVSRRNGPLAGCSLGLRLRTAGCRGKSYGATRRRINPLRTLGPCVVPTPTNTNLRGRDFT